MPRPRQTSPRSVGQETGFFALPLRLIAARGGVGIELSEPRQFGPVTLTELSWSLPGLAFPLDLSGGVREFRHRRGQVQHAVLELDLAQLAAWSFARLSGALGGLDAPVGAWCSGGGIGIGVSGADGVVAFELLWAPSGHEARWVISNPRCAGSLRGPAVSHVFLVVDRLMGKWARRRGRIIDFGAVVGTLSRDFLPNLGVKVPSSSDLWFGPLSVAEEHIVVGATTHPPSKELPAPTLNALEFAELVQTADDLLYEGKVDAARAEYVAALERAPRHPELCRSIAAIDKDFEERGEAALGLLVEALPATAFGLIGAELLSRVGDEEGAELSIARQVELERYSPLAARLWLRASQLTQDNQTRMLALDRAVAVCPSSKPARWARFHHRLTLADLNGAVADAEHLEAATTGNQEKHQTMLAAAQAMQALGFVQPARRLFERALRYLPKDAAAALGLARCFLADDMLPRALVLLRRAAELTDERDPLSAEVDLELAKALASGGRDLPQAIARARRVHGQDARAIEARALEARWRARLGDSAGAAVAYGRLCDAVEMNAQPRREYAQYVLEAARFARESGELAAAVRQSSLALSLAPNDAEVLRQYREVAALVAEPRQEPRRVMTPTEPPVATPRLPVQDPSPVRVPAGDGSVSPGAAVDSAECEARAEQLLQRLIAGAQLDEGELADLELGLTSAGREQELHALLWARYEDASDEQQQHLVPRLRTLLKRLVDEARSREGNIDVELYEFQLQRLAEHG